MIKVTKNYIFRLLNQSLIMQLATSHDNKPWVCTVYFVADNDLNIYWLSWPERRHSKEIASNSNIALTMAIKPDLPVIGLGAEGQAMIVNEKSIVKPVMDLYIKKYGAGHAFYDKFLAGDNHHVLYKFKPEKFVLFDEVNFPKNTSVDMYVKS